eukprot:531767-Prorocentrum_minimum.AAC.1
MISRIQSQPETTQVQMVPMAPGADTKGNVADTKGNVAERSRWERTTGEVALVSQFATASKILTTTLTTSTRSSSLDSSITKGARGDETNAELEAVEFGKIAGRNWSRSGPLHGRNAKGKFTEVLLGGGKRRGERTSLTFAEKIASQHVEPSSLPVKAAPSPEEVDARGSKVDARGSK